LLAKRETKLYDEAVFMKKSRIITKGMPKKAGQGRDKPVARFAAKPFESKLRNIRPADGLHRWRISKRSFGPLIPGKTAAASYPEVLVYETGGVGR